MEKNKINYSIIIPHYNSFEKLQRLIKSIPTREDIEIIVIDDKSPIEVIKDIKFLLGDKVKIMENKTIKKGAGTCRNLGLEIANGRWILFADADDFFLKDWINEVDKYKESKFDIIYFIPTSMYEDNLKTAVRHIPYENMLIKFLEKRTLKTEERIKYRFTVPWSKMIKKELYKENNLKFDEVIASNDVMFSVKTAYNAKNIEVSEQKIYCVTTSKGSLTQKLNKEILESRLSVAIRVNKFLKERKINKHMRSLLPHIIKSLNFELKYFFKILKISLINGINILEFFERYFKDIGIKNILSFRTKDRKYYVKEKTK